MSSIPLLVCCDAGAAGRELLARQDMVLRWALTLDEAKAVFAADPPRLVLARETMADDVLSHLPSGLPAVVLLEPDGWSRRERYAQAGATALVRANNRERILEAVSELTGLAFRVHPRIPLDKQVSILVDDQAHVLEAVEMSGSGISVRNLPGARVGSRVSVSLDFIEPSMRLMAVVVRFGQDDGQPVAGLAFDDPSGGDRTALAEFIHREQQQCLLPEPEKLTADVGTYTLDLFHHQAGADIQMFKDMMSASMFPLSGSIGPRMPSWLEKVAHQLTLVEREALRGTPSPVFATAAIEFRIALAHERAEAGGIVSSDMGMDVIEFSRSLATEGEGSAPETLLQITEIRAALLVQAYADLRMSVGAPGEPQNIAPVKKAGPISNRTQTTL